MTNRHRWCSLSSLTSCVGPCPTPCRVWTRSGIWRHNFSELRLNMYMKEIQYIRVIWPFIQRVWNLGDCLYLLLTKTMHFKVLFMTWLCFLFYDETKSFISSDNSLYLNLTYPSEYVSKKQNKTSWLRVNFYVINSLRLGSLYTSRFWSAHPRRPDWRLNPYGPQEPWVGSTYDFFLKINTLTVLTI